MTIKNKFFSGLTLAIAVFALSTFTLAQEAKTTGDSDSKMHKGMKGDGHHFGKDKDGRRGMRGDRGGMFMMRGLDLTDAQKAQFKALHEANKPSEATRTEMKTLGKAKHDGTLTADQQSRLTALKQEAKVHAESVHSQMLAILTPEQKVKMDARKQEMQKRMQERKMRRQNNDTTDTPKIS